MSFIHSRNGRYWVDRRLKLGTLIPSEIVLDECRRFLDAQHGGRLLDLGAGSRPYAVLYDRVFDASVAVDVPYSPHDQKHIDVFAPADDLPFDDESFECVLCTEVLEHCPDPQKVMGEIHRVLTPGGACFLTTPFLVPLHEMPHDYYRYTPSALTRLAENAGLVVESIKPKGDYFAVALGLLLYPWSKLWQVAASRTGLPLYHPLNPLVGPIIVAPQLAYLAYWRRAQNTRVSRKLSYITRGYITTLKRR